MINSKNSNAPVKSFEKTPRPRSQRSDFLRAIWITLRAFLVAYLLVLLLAMWFEESLIFFPFKYPAGDWTPAGIVVEDANFTAADGTKLHGWYVPHEEPAAYVLFLHGNAGNVTDRIEALRALHDTVGAAVLILDYRGYGRSEGKPNEQGVLQDARAARSWLAERAGIDESQIVLLGESIGGAVAVQLAAEAPPRALVLQNPFTSMPDVAAVHYPFLPVRLLMDTQLNSLAKIKDYRGPLMISHGADDEVVPLAQGRRLFDAASSQQKQFFEIPGGTHNELLPPAYYLALREFLR
jgi:fermentation-respiration switch protein FrsA (DUF1100 family)